MLRCNDKKMNEMKTGEIRASTEIYLIFRGELQLIFTF